MPIHNWRRVSPGTFHHFHTSWVVEIGKALNAGILPPSYYAMAEQVTGPVDPDVITLKTRNGKQKYPGEGNGGLALATVPPKVRFTAISEEDQYVQKRQTLAIRHSSDDELVALVEILSPGNKANRRDFRAFIDKAVSALRQRIHLLLVDLFPPTRRDPQGIHGAVWAEFNEDHDFVLPTDKPLTLAAYSSGLEKRAYIEPVAAGDILPDMPLFLTPEEYVLVPLEATYQVAFEAVPWRWREVLEEKAGP
jgi:hypothetical protein